MVDHNNFAEPTTPDEKRDANAQLGRLHEEDIEGSSQMLAAVNEHSMPRFSGTRRLVSSSALSRPLKPGEKIDFFMSHSWHDDPILKWKELKKFVKAFIKKHRREPTFWLDKACIDQDNIQDGLKVLPVNVMACQKMLVLCGPTYSSRLWCTWELFTLFSFSEMNEALAKIKIVSFGESALVSNRSDSDLLSRHALYRAAENGTWQAAAVRSLDLLLEYDVAQSHCYDPNEEHSLRTVIRAVGESKFNRSIQRMAEAVIEEQERQQLASERKRNRKLSLYGASTASTSGWRSGSSGVLSTALSSSSMPMGSSSTTGRALTS